LTKVGNQSLHDAVNFWLCSSLSVICLIVSISKWNSAVDCVCSITVATVVRHCVPNAPATRWQYRTLVTSVWSACVMTVDCCSMMNSERLLPFTLNFQLKHGRKQLIDLRTLHLNEEDTVFCSRWWRAVFVTKNYTAL